MSRSSASVLFLGRQWFILLPVASTGERGYLFGVVPRSVGLRGPSHTGVSSPFLGGFSLLISLGFGVLTQTSFMVGGMWPSGKPGESACVPPAFDLPAQGVHIVPEARC